MDKWTRHKLYKKIERAKALSNDVFDLQVDVRHKKRNIKIINNKVKEAGELLFEVLGYNPDRITKLRCYNLLLRSMPFGNSDNWSGRDDLKYLKKINRIINRVPKNKRPLSLKYAELSNWYCLQYDIGICYFELKEYGNAEKYFKRLKGKDDITYNMWMARLKLIERDFYNAFIFWTKLILITKKDAGTKKDTGIIFKSVLFNIKRDINKYFPIHKFD